MTRDFDPGRDNRLVVLGIALGGLIILALVWPAFTERVHTRGDLGGFNLPIRAFYAQALASGDSPIWWPNLWSGYYLHGESQMGMYHPLHWLLYRFLPLGTAFGHEAALPFPLLFAGTFLLLRRFSLPPGAAILGAIAFAFAGWNLRHFQHINMLLCLAHMPWLLLAVRVAVTDDDARRRARARFAVAILTASQVLIGFPQYVLYTGFMELLLLAHLWRAHGWRSWRPPALLGVGIAKALGALTGAVQLLPTLDLLSTQPARTDPSVGFLFTHSLHPPNLAVPLAPYLFTGGAFDSDHENAIYFGAAGAILCLWLALRFRVLEPAFRRLTLHATGLGVVALIFGMGKFGFVYPWIARLPILNIFRAPTRYLCLLALAVAILCAIAFMDLAKVAQRRSAETRPPLRPLGLAILASVTIAGLGLFVRATSDGLIASQLATPAEIAIGPLLVAAAVALVAAASRGHRWAIPALLVFLAVDLGIYGLLDTYRDRPKSIAALIASRTPPPEFDGGRIDSNDTTLTLAGARLTGGYVGLIPSPRLDRATRAAQRVAGVRWSVEPRTDPGNDKQSKPEQEWLRVDDPLPRAWLVGRTEVSADPGRDILEIDPARVALLDAPIDGGLSAPDSTPNVPVRVLRDRPGDLAFEVQSATRQLLVVSESWHGGWICASGEESHPALRVNGDFSACIVDAGTRQVTLTFRPASLRIGARLSMLGLLGILGLPMPLRGFRRATLNARSRPPTDRPR